MQNTTKKMPLNNETYWSPNIETPAALQQLAAEVRASDLFLAAIAPDGRITPGDSQPSQFLLRYILPCLTREGAEFVRQSDDPRINIVNTIPGLIAATFAMFERGKIIARLLLVGKSDRFTFNDSISRICTEEVIDESWLARVITSIPSFTTAAMIAKASLIKQQRHLLAA